MWTDRRPFGGWCDGECRRRLRHTGWIAAGRAARTLAAAAAGAGLRRRPLRAPRRRARPPHGRGARGPGLAPHARVGRLARAAAGREGAPAEAAALLLAGDVGGGRGGRR